MVKWQRVATPTGAVLMAKTGDTTRSPGHGGFSFRSLVTTVFEASCDPLEGGVIAHETIQLLYTVVTGSSAILRCGHGVTAEFWWTQIVSPVYNRLYSYKYLIWQSVSKRHS